MTKDNVDVIPTNPNPKLTIDKAAKRKDWMRYLDIDSDGFPVAKKIYSWCRLYRHYEFTNVNIRYSRYYNM